MIFVKNEDIVGNKEAVDYINKVGVVYLYGIHVTEDQYSEFKKKLQKEPTKLELYRHLVSSLKKWAGSKFEIADKREVVRRAGICNGCPFYKDGSSVFFPRCSKCGCTNLKNWMQTTKCPQGKW